MSDILDDLFSWALQQPDGNVMTVQFAMATNEMTNNLVSGHPLPGLCRIAALRNAENIRTNGSLYPKLLKRFQSFGRRPIKLRAKASFVIFSFAAKPQLFVMALSFAAALAYFARDPAEVDRFASELIELSTRHNFVILVGSRSTETEISEPEKQRPQHERALHYFPANHTTSIR